MDFPLCLDVCDSLNPFPISHFPIAHSVFNFDICMMRYHILYYTANGLQLAKSYTYMELEQVPMLVLAISVSCVMGLK